MQQSNKEFEWFKIDLIVWKLNKITPKSFDMILFKIDLIVWKCTSISETSGEAQGLK